jgi:hypothetical protein
MLDGTHHRKGGRGVSMIGFEQLCIMVGGEVYGNDVQHDVSLLVKVITVWYMSGVHLAALRGSGNGCRWLGCSQ